MKRSISAFAALLLLLGALLVGCPPPFGPPPGPGHVPHGPHLPHPPHP